MTGHQAQGCGLLCCTRGCAFAYWHVMRLSTCAWVRACMRVYLHTPRHDFKSSITYPCLQDGMFIGCDISLLFIDFWPNLSFHLFSTHPLPFIRVYWKLTSSARFAISNLQQQSDRRMLPLLQGILFLRSHPPVPPTRNREIIKLLLLTIQMNSWFRSRLCSCSGPKGAPSKQIP